MIPIDPTWVNRCFLFQMKKTIILIDAGFLSIVSKHFSKGIYLKFDIVNFAKNLAKAEKLYCEHIFYYTAPPFQGTPPSNDERFRKEKYDEFVSALSKNKLITVREGRVQKVKESNGFKYTQKGVDSLVVMDLMSAPLEYPDIKNIILIACDSDFVPPIKHLKKYSIQTILYTYFDKKRNSKFSTSNELIQIVSTHKLINKSLFT
jgi:uncharacterized LabA/DUF88 family protein